MFGKESVQPAVKKSKRKISGIKLVRENIAYLECVKNVRIKLLNLIRLHSNEVKGS